MVDEVAAEALFEVGAEAAFFWIEACELFRFRPGCEEILREIFGILSATAE